MFKRDDFVREFSAHQLLQKVAVLRLFQLSFQFITDQIKEFVDVLLHLHVNGLSVVAF